ncbi:MAG: substrate-binding domain-containing protein [Rhizobiaceae bacterium]|nr:substrate-binding domain-containing protein [Rhizobiaceae bacterium]
MANGSKKETKSRLRPAASQGKRPTLKDIAYMTGLGVTTVSRALNDAPDIGQGTKERVRLVATQIGYRPNRAGVRLRTGKTNVICLILNTEEDVMGLTAPLVSGISEIVGNTSYHLVMTPYGINQDPLEPVKYVVETGAADGIILSRTEPDDVRVRYLIENGVPFVTHGRTELDLPHAFHDFDNERYTSTAVGLLKEKGRKRVALVAPPGNFTFSKHMKSGFYAGLENHGLMEIAVRNVTTDSPFPEIQAEMERLMDTSRDVNARPDGIICGSSDVAIAAVAAIEKMGLVLGEDVDVVAKDSLGLLVKLRPNIIIIPENFRIAGRDLASILLALINGESPQDHQNTYFPE